MLFYVLDQNYNTLDLVDTFEESFWIERYYDVGEFEIKLPASVEMTALLERGRYLQLVGEKNFMIIEKRVTDWHWKDGDMFTISGRDLGSILDRRIIWKKIVFNNEPFDTVIRRIINENVISPSDSNRKIPGLSYKTANDAAINEVRLTAEYHGENVLTTICELCQQYSFGWHLLPINNGEYQFELYNGVDRSYAQDKNPWIVFSNKLENIGDISITENDVGIRNSALVYNSRDYREPITDSQGKSTGEYKEYTVETQVECYTGASIPTGLDRREMYIESNKSNKDENGDTMTTANYKKVLTAQGNEGLADYKLDTAFAGKVDANRQFIYQRDFNIGDICQIDSKSGIQKRTRIIEVVRTHDKTGDHTVPSFINVDDDDA